MAKTLTVIREGKCLTSILNMNDEVSVSLPIVDLEECEFETNTVQVANFVAQGAVTRKIGYESCGRQLGPITLMARGGELL
jgi:hypothetical protein